MRVLPTTPPLPAFRQEHGETGLSVADFSLRGVIPGPGGGQAGLERNGEDATFQVTWADDNLDFALDGYMVRDGRMLTDSPMARQALAAAVRGDLGAYLAGMHNGAFNLVVHDRERQSSLIATDRRGVLPLFVDERACASGGPCRFASDYATLFAMTAGWPSVDRLGAAELYLFGCPLGDRTAYAGISALPAGSVISYDWQTGQRHDTAWATALDSEPPATEVKLDDLLDEICAAIDRAVSAFDVPGGPFDGHMGIKLSGGMDSRLIGAAWHGAPLRAYTYGEPASAEVRCATRLAEVLGFPHRLVPVEGDLFAGVYASQHARFRIAEWFHALLVPAMEEDGVRGVFDGLCGDVLVGGVTLKQKGAGLRYLREALGMSLPPIPLPTDDLDVARLIYAHMKVPEAGFQILTAAARQEIDDLKDAILADIAAQAALFRPGACSMEQLHTRITLNNRIRRYVAMQGAVCRPRVESFYPFLDDSITRLSSRIPARLLANKRLYIELFRQRYPKIRQVPGVNSLLPYTVPTALHFLGRIGRYCHDAVLQTLSRAASGRGTNSVQWEPWFRQNAALRHGLTNFVRSSPVVDAIALENAFDAISRGKAMVRGTRLMLSASYAALFH